MKRLLIAFVAVVSVALFARETRRVEFGRGKWDSSQWILVKSPRWSHFGGWVQKDGHIENEVPAGVDAQTLQGKRAAETYTSMVWKEPVSGNVVVKAKMSYAYQMAPLLVIAPELGKSAEGIPEYREHWEVVLYEKGLNVWHHEYKDGKPFWHLAARAGGAFEKDKVYELTVTIAFSAKGSRAPCIITVAANGIEFSYRELNLKPGRYYVGVTACEGVNRFYDFTIVK
jgi:hypothetical protein